MGMLNFFKGVPKATGATWRGLKTATTWVAEKSVKHMKDMSRWGLVGGAVGGAIGYANAAQDRSQGNEGVDTLDSIVRGAAAGAILGFGGRAAYKGLRFAANGVGKARTAVRGWWKNAPHRVHSNNAFVGPPRPPKDPTIIAANTASVREQFRANRGKPNAGIETLKKRVREGDHRKR